MSDYQEGRTSAIFSTGVKVEDLNDIYEKEASNLATMKIAFAMTIKALENYQLMIYNELHSAKIPLKEAEYGRIHINQCIEIAKQLFNDTEIKRIHSEGASVALKQAIAEIKTFYDFEKSKLELQQNWENDPNKDMKTRPVGTNPGNSHLEHLRQQKVE